MKDPEIRTLIHGSACLSTPFINARRRNLGAVGLWPIVGFLSLTIISAAAWVGQLIAPESDWRLQFLAGFLVVMALPSIGANHLLKWLTSLASQPETANYTSLFNKIEHTFDFPPLGDKDILILRAGGDEASALLAASQLVSWVISRSYKAIGHAFAWLIRMVIRISESLILFLLKKSKWVGGIFLVLWLALWILNSQFYFSDNVYLFLFAAPLALLFILYASFFVVAMALVLISVLLFPIALLMCLAVLPFGFESVLFSLLLEVTVEATPPGQWMLHQLGASASNVPLWHSATYTETSAIDIICSWLQAVGKKVRR